MKGQGNKKPSITANQCREIHALESTLGITDGDSRIMHLDLFGVEKSMCLSSFYAGHLTRVLERSAVKMGVWPRSAVNRAMPRMRHKRLFRLPERKQVSV
jgi:hypothetical protein